MHIVFSTKERIEFLKAQELRKDTHLYLMGICRKLGTPALIVGGVQDHVHILCRFSRNHTISEIIRELKKGSSKWIKEKNPILWDFHWQDGYGAFSLSPSHVEDLKEYIVNQEEHHRRESFKDEFRRILENYDVTYDERYLWD
jgi:REP element-mobilizing transposase RayT